MQYYSKEFTAESCGISNGKITEELSWMVPRQANF